MDAIKSVILYSLFIMNSAYGQAQDDAVMLQDNNQDMQFIYDESSDEIYPLDDFDTIFLIPGIEDDILDIEFDNNIIKNDTNDQMVVEAVPLQEIITFKNDSEKPMAESEYKDHDEKIVIEIEDEDDIVPVPHELINSVKKAQKKKKKLEKKERKSFFKQSKKKKHDSQ